MRVRLNVNLGSVDALSHGLDHNECQAGMEPEVDNAQGQWLVENGHAVEVKGVAKPAAIQGVPPKRGSVEKATEDVEKYRKRAKGEDE